MTPAPGPARSRSTAAPGILRRADLLADGLSDNHIRRARRLGLLTPILPGVYLPASPPGDLDERATHRLALDAVLGTMAGDPVVSHRSAALLHGLPVDDDDPADDQVMVHLIRPGAAKSRRGARFTAHRATLEPDDVVRIDGLAVTSPARTVVDCAVLLPGAEALIIARAAVARRLVTPAALAHQLARHARVPGVRAAAGVIARAVDGADGHPGTVMRTCAPVLSPADSHW